MTISDRMAIERSDAGFSLVEMLVVLAIIGLLFSIALPSFRSLTRPTPAAVAREVLHAAQLTRLGALKSGTARNLILDANTRLIQSEGHADHIAVPTAISFSATIGINDKTAVDKGSITFFPNGGSTGGTIRFRGEGASDAVVSINWLTGIASLSEARSHDIR